MHDPALIRDDGVAANEDVVGDCLPEDLHLEHVRDNLFRLTIQIWMYKSNVVVACDNVSESGKSLFYSLDGDSIGEGVSEVLEFLICCGRGYQQTVSVAFTIRHGG